LFSPYTAFPPPMTATKAKQEKKIRPGSRAASSLPGIEKAPTGIAGLDEITNGGLPSGRPTLVCGSAGSGKTMLAVEFLVHGAREQNEPGVFMMFEENAEELAANVRSLGMDLDQLVAEEKLVLEYVHIERSEIEETGEYDLEGLFIRLGHAVDTIGAKRVVLDTLEALFAGLPNHGILRAELRRLFRWLKDRGLTAIITGERGENSLTRYGLEEYVADCVILLDHRIEEQVSTRRLRVIKYRGTEHGTNEYPFLIGKHGLSVLPITSLQLNHDAPTTTVASGIPQLDEMLASGGFYRGSSVLVSGAPGTGKSSITAAFVKAACDRGERALLFAYEESATQIVRNMRSVGIDLQPCIRKGLLQIHASRPTLHGLEQHLVIMYDTVREFDPAVVAVDPITNLVPSNSIQQVKPMLMRLIDFLKQRLITALFTSLTDLKGDVSEGSMVGVSSLMDTWLQLRNVESNGERNRTMHILKSRGTGHSNQVREFLLSEQGLQLMTPYIGTSQVLTGTARISQELQERMSTDLRRQSHERRVRELASRRKAIEAQIASLQAQAEAEAAELAFATAERELDERTKQETDLSVSRVRTGGGRSAGRSHGTSNGKPRGRT
jgi:circadian clock protein KaiC